jgi:hypothetical protein
MRDARDSAAAERIDPETGEIVEAPVVDPRAVFGTGPDDERQDVIDEITERVVGDGTRFAVTDLESLDWAARKGSALARRIAAIESAAAAETERIRLEAGRLTEPLLRQADFFRGLCSEYLRAQHETEGIKTIERLYVRATARKRPDGVVYDEAAFLAFLGLEGGGRPTLEEVARWLALVSEWWGDARAEHVDRFVRIHVETARAEIKKAAAAGALQTTAPVETEPGEVVFSVVFAGEKE